MDAASWPSGAAADASAGEVVDDELEEDSGGPPPAPALPGDPLPDASMSTRAASSTGARPMSTSGAGVRLSWYITYLNLGEMVH